MIRLLVAEGNTASHCARIAEGVGATPGESYAAVLTALAPETRIDICAPADGDAATPEPLDSYHGVVFTGSALNIYAREPESLRQIAFMRELFDLGVPVFGSCWGLQVATVAAGGEVGPNTRGREVAFARKIMLTEAGRGHALHQGRPLAFDAPAIHGDEVKRLPSGAIVTAYNDVSAVQAAEIRSSAGVFWGVQYHPEFDFHDLSAMIARYGLGLVDEGFFHDLAELERYAIDLEALHTDVARRDIAWRFGLGDDLLDAGKRRSEIANWIERQVKPFRAKG